MAAGSCLLHAGCGSGGRAELSTPAPPRPSQPVVAPGIDLADLDCVETLPSARGLPAGCDEAPAEALAIHGCAVSPPRAPDCTHRDCMPSVRVEHWVEIPGVGGSDLYPVSTSFHGEGSGDGWRLRRVEPWPAPGMDAWALELESWFEQTRVQPAVRAAPRGPLCLLAPLAPADTQSTAWRLAEGTLTIRAVHEERCSATSYQLDPSGPTRVDEVPCLCPEGAPSVELSEVCAGAPRPTGLEVRARFTGTEPEVVSLDSCPSPRSSVSAYLLRVAAPEGDVFYPALADDVVGRLSIGERDALVLSQYGQPSVVAIDPEGSGLCHLVGRPFAGGEITAWDPETSTARLRRRDYGRGVDLCFEARVIELRGGQLVTEERECPP